MTVEGIVKQFKWANPHSWLEIEVPNSEGSTDIWNLEMTSPAFLVRAGWKSTSIKAGDKVKAVARPFRNGDPGGIFVSVTPSTYSWSASLFPSQSNCRKSVVRGPKVRPRRFRCTRSTAARRADGSSDPTFSARRA